MGSDTPRPRIPPLTDVVFAVGQYTLVAMALKSFGTPLDDGLEGF